MKLWNQIWLGCFVVILLVPGVVGLQVDFDTEEGEYISGIFPVSVQTDIDSTVTLTVRSGQNVLFEGESVLAKIHTFHINTLTGAYPDGEYELSFVVSGGSEEYLATINVVVDNTAPQIIEYVVTQLTPRLAMITIITTEMAISSLDYGDDTLLANTQSITDFATVHVYTLSDLQPGSDNYYEITVCDTRNNCAQSGISAFLTPNEPAPATVSVFDTPQLIERYKGSLIVTRNGIYLTYRLNHIRGLIFRTAKDRKVLTRVSELTKVDANTVRFRIEDSKYTLELGTVKDIDFDGDGVNDLQIELLSIPDAQTAKLRVSSEYTAVQDHGVIFIPNAEIGDTQSMDDGDMEDEDVIEETVKDTNRLVNWLVAGQILLVLLFLFIIFFGITRKPRR